MKKLILLLVLFSLIYSCGESKPNVEYTEPNYTYSIDDLEIDDYEVGDIIYDETENEDEEFEKKIYQSIEVSGMGFQKVRRKSAGAGPTFYANGLYKIEERIEIMKKGGYKEKEFLIEKVNDTTYKATRIFTNPIINRETRITRNYFFNWDGTLISQTTWDEYGNRIIKDKMDITVENISYD